MSHVIHDRFARLKALQPPSLPAPSELRWQSALPHVQTETYQTVRVVPDGSERLEQILGASAKANQYGEHLALHCWFGEPARYTPNLQALRLLMPNATEDVADAEQWLFLDVETTGLAGGSGTYAFLVGIAWWEGGGLEVEQFFMRDYSEECSLLFALGERLAERRVLVTFNGKSFDWPLLETRYRMSRKIPPPAPRAHLDFLHPARNLWRLRLGSVRLSELERHVLGWDRGADLISELIPQIYLDFVRGDSPERLIPVFHHNQMDLRGLAGLSSRVLSLLNDAERLGQDGLELFGVSRICERRGDATRARKLYEQSIASTLPAETDARHGAFLPGWRNAAVISQWRANFGVARWAIRVWAMRLTSNWRFTTNITPATHAGRGRLFAKRSMNSTVQTAPAQSAQVHIVRSTHDSNIEWVGWNEKACGRYGMSWTRDCAQDSESNGRRAKTCVGDHRGHPRRASSKDD